LSDRRISEEDGVGHERSARTGFAGGRRSFPSAVARGLIRRSDCRLGGRAARYASGNARDAYGSSPFAGRPSKKRWTESEGRSLTICPRRPSNANGTSFSEARHRRQGS
jgi:hypothetical protein